MCPTARIHAADDDADDDASQPLLAFSHVAVAWTWFSFQRVALPDSRERPFLHVNVELQREHKDQC